MEEGKIRCPLQVLVGPLLVHTQNSSLHLANAKMVVLDKCYRTEPLSTNPNLFPPQKIALCCWDLTDCLPKARGGRAFPSVMWTKVPTDHPRPCHNTVTVIETTINSVIFPFRGIPICLQDGR